MRPPDRRRSGLESERAASEGALRFRRDRSGTRGWLRIIGPACLLVLGCGAERGPADAMLSSADSGSALDGSVTDSGSAIDSGSALDSGSAVDGGSILAPGRYEDQRIRVGEVDRTFDLFVPEGEPGDRPMVMLFHGNGGSARALTGRTLGASPLSVMLEVARRERFVVVAAQGLEGSTGSAGWNDCRGDAATNPVADDVAFVEALVDEAVRRWGVARERVAASGMSNGGHFSLRLAIERPDLVRAVAPIAAAMPFGSECSPPSRAVAVLFVNGTADPILPYGGGAVGTGGSDRGTTLAVDASVRVWAELAGATAETSEPVADLTSADGCTASRARFTGGSVPVELLVVEGGGHTEPSLEERYSAGWLRIVGRQSADLESAEEIWRFFAPIIAMR